jgi:cation-transporting P-type ATPase J
VAGLDAFPDAAGGWEPGLAGLRVLRERRLDVDLLMVAAAVGAAAIGQLLLTADAGEETVDAASLDDGDVILVRPGERVAADGQVVEGRATLVRPRSPVSRVPRSRSRATRCSTGH